MASASSVLAVIRAAHPELKNKHDKLAFAVHGLFLASGYRLVGTGAADADPEEAPATPEPEADVSIEGWNSLGDSYMLRYVRDGDKQARPVVLSMLVVGDKLLVDATRVGSDGEAVHTMELKLDDYVTAEEGQHYAAMYKELDRLVGRLQGSVLSQLSADEAKEKGAPNPAAAGQSSERSRDPELPSSNPLADQRGGRVLGVPVPGAYDADLMPMGGAGFPAGYGVPVPGRGGMAVGPDDPFFRGLGVRPNHQPPGGLPPGLPPGARFDPYGPPIPGFEPGRFGSGRGSSGAGLHPDLAFRPP